MNTGSKVRVVDGRLQNALAGRVGEVDCRIAGSGKICATFKDGFGDDAKQDAFLFAPDELREVGSR